MGWREEHAGGGGPTPATSTRVVWTVIAAQFAPPFMFSAVAVALPDLGAEFSASGTQLSLVELLFLAGSASFLLPIGWLADAGDERTVFKLGILVFGVSSLLLGTLHHLPLILGLRFVQGVAGAAFSATGPAILADIVPAERRGRAFGASLAATYSGLTLGPIIGGLLVDAFGWRSVFFAGGAALLLAFTVLSRTLYARGRRPDRLPHLPSVALVVGAVLAGVAGSASMGSSPLGLPLLGLSGVLAALFVLIQPRLERPLVNVTGVLANRTLRSALTVQLLVYLTAFSSTFLLSLLLQVSLGRTARVAGQVLAISTVLMAIGAPVAGRLADRFRPSSVSWLGVLLLVACALLGTQLSAQATIAGVAAVLILQGLGFGFFSSPNMTTIMGSVPASELSLTSALSTKARHVGMVAGMFLATTLIGLALGDAPLVEHPEELGELVSRAYGVLAVANLGALVVATRARWRRPRG